MARRKSPGRRGKAEREPVARSQKREKAAPAQVEVVEESGGVGFEGGIAIATTVILLIAFFLVDALRGQYGEALFLN